MARRNRRIRRYVWHVILYGTVTSWRGRQHSEQRGPDPTVAHGRYPGVLRVGLAWQSLRASSVHIMISHKFAFGIHCALACRVAALGLQDSRRAAVQASRAPAPVRRTATHTECESIVSRHPHLLIETYLYPFVRPSVLHIRGAHWKLQPAGLGHSVVASGLPPLSVLAFVP